MTKEVDTHDSAGIARWLMERYENTKQFLALTDDRQRNQFLKHWQRNVLPHLAFRFKQAAQMIIDLNTKRLQAEHERDVLIEQLAQSCDEDRADPEFGGCPLEKRAHEPKCEHVWVPAILPCRERPDELHDFRHEVCDCGASRDDTFPVNRRAEGT